MDVSRPLLRPWRALLALLLCCGTVAGTASGPDRDAQARAAARAELTRVQRAEALVRSEHGAALLGELIEARRGSRAEGSR